MFGGSLLGYHWFRKRDWLGARGWVWPRADVIGSASELYIHEDSTPKTAPRPRQALAPPIMSTMEKAPSSTSATATAFSPASSRTGIVRNPSRGNTRATDIESGVGNTNGNGAHDDANAHHHHRFHLGDPGSLPHTKQFFRRFKGEGRRVPGWVESANNTLRHSCEYTCLDGRILLA